MTNMLLCHSMRVWPALSQKYCLPKYESETCWSFTIIYFGTLRGNINWAPSSQFVSSSIPSRQILIAHAQPFRGARDLAFCLKVPLGSLFVWASSGGSGETAWMRRLAWTFTARIGDKYQIRLTQPKLMILQYSDRLVWTNSVDPNQIAPEEAVQSGSTLFAISSAFFWCINEW